jgi:hypothetical protein
LAANYLDRRLHVSIDPKYQPPATSSSPSTMPLSKTIGLVEMGGASLQVWTDSFGNKALRC